MHSELMGIEIPAACMNGAVTIGNFDGVHRGHRQILKSLCALAQKVHGPAVVLTFDPPPARLLRPSDAPLPLSTPQWKAEMLKGTGVDFVVVVKTNPEILSLSADEFFKEVLVDSLHIRGIVEGENFRFGKERSGTTELLRCLSSMHGVHCEIIKPELADKEWISSTRIRSLIESGSLREANQLLLGNYRISGIVESGMQRGRTIGFPTANLSSIATLIPAVGVYAARLASVRDLDSNYVSDGMPVAGCPIALHIGPNPTFGESLKKVEAHLIGYRGDLYGRVLEIEIVDRIRDVIQFGSKDDLLSQLNRDVIKASEIIAMGN